MKHISDSFRPSLAHAGLPGLVAGSPCPPPPPASRWPHNKSAHCESHPAGNPPPRRPGSRQAENARHWNEPRQIRSWPGRRNWPSPAASPPGWGAATKSVPATKSNPARGFRSSPGPETGGRRKPPGPPGPGWGTQGKPKTGPERRGDRAVGTGGAARVSAPGGGVVVFPGTAGGRAAWVRKMRHCSTLMTSPQ